MSHSSLPYFPSQHPLFPALSPPHTIRVTRWRWRCRDNQPGLRQCDQQTIHDFRSCRVVRLNARGDDSISVVPVVKYAWVVRAAIQSKMVVERGKQYGSPDRSPLSAKSQYVRCLPACFQLPFPSIWSEILHASAYHYYQLYSFSNTQTDHFYRCPSHEECTRYCHFDTFEMPSYSLSGTPTLVSTNDPPSSPKDVVPIWLACGETSTSL